MPSYAQFNIEHRKDREDGFCNDFISKVGYKCITCGAEISPATVSFYQKDHPNDWPEHLKCYDCQGLNQ